MIKVFKKSNKGITLIELIVTILIMSIMAGTIFLFVNASKSSYGQVHEEVTMQTEADITLNFIENIAYGAVTYKYTDDFIVNVSGEQTRFNVLCMETLNPDPYYYFIVHAVDYKEIRFLKLKCDAPDSQLKWLAGTETGNINNIDIVSTLSVNNIFSKANQRCFVAKYVTDFNAIIPDDVNKKGLLRISVDLQYGNSTFSSSRNISSRNVI